MEHLYWSIIQYQLYVLEAFKTSQACHCPWLLITTLCAKAHTLAAGYRIMEIFPMQDVLHNAWSCYAGCCRREGINSHTQNWILFSNNNLTAEIAAVLLWNNKFLIRFKAWFAWWNFMPSAMILVKSPWLERSLTLG